MLGYNQKRLFEEFIWTKFLNERKGNFNPRVSVSIAFLEDNNEWYRKLDMIEYTLDYLSENAHRNPGFKKVYEQFVFALNSEFVRLCFGYRVVDNIIVDIISEEEISSIETTLHEHEGNVRMHLSKALELYAKRPDPDYANYIKESISAVEAFCRSKTGENTLGAALKKIEGKDIRIHNMLKTVFEKLYAYTNQPDNGIRHALMDVKDSYVPSADEAMLMLVSCSTFINYLTRKTSV